jgi:hypothetical protein
MEHNHQLCGSVGPNGECLGCGEQMAYIRHMRLKVHSAYCPAKPETTADRNPLHLSPGHPRVIKSDSTDYFLIPEGQEGEKEAYWKAVATRDWATARPFEEGRTGWQLLDPVPWD